MQHDDFIVTFKPRGGVWTYGFRRKDTGKRLWFEGGWVSGDRYGAERAAKRTLDRYIERQRGKYERTGDNL